MSSDLDNRSDNDPRPDPERFQNARAAVGLPATLLIVIGALTLLGAILGLIQRASLPAQFDQMIATIDADPKLTREDKDAWIDALTFAKDAVQNPTAIISYVLNIVCALILMIGGIKMLQLSGPALPTISAVLAMIPCTVGCCCVPGLPVGIWALIVLNRPDVRAAMAARNISPEYPDDSETR
jgi:hypothetical protein